MTLSLKASAVFVLLALAAFVFSLAYFNRADASVSVSNEYYATTTAASTVYGNTITASTKIKQGQGVLGSVIITGATAGVINFYNATTSNVSLRTGNKATSTILIASIPASAAAGTYTFDALVTDGLYIDLVSGTMPTTTVTYR